MFQKASTYGLIGLAAFVAIPVVYLVLLEMDWPITYIKVSTLHRWILLSGELLIGLAATKFHFRDGWNANKILPTLRDVLIANCLFALPFIGYYSDETRADVPLIRAIQAYIIPGYAVLLAVTALFVVLSNLHRIRSAWKWSLANRELFSLQGLRSLHHWLVEQLEAQRIYDEQAGIQRVTRFVERYPGIANTPILGRLEIAFAREGSVTLLAMLVLAAAGLVLRLWNLDLLPPYADETNHLLAAKEIFQGTQLNEVEYTRSLYTVTLPVVMGFKLWGMSLWSARFVGVVVNMLALIPLVWLARKVNKPVALLSVGLFVFSPWMIAVSRNVREYGYYAFFFYLIACWMVGLYHAIPDQLELAKDYRKLLTWKNLFYLGALGFVIYYVTRLDPFSTSKIILVVYPVAGLLLLRKINWQSRRNKIWSLLFFILAGMGFGVLLVWIGGQHLQILDFDTFYLSLFFEAAPQQWYFHRFPIAIVLLTCAFLAITVWDRKKFALPFIVLTYLLAQLSFAIFNFRENNRPRYALTIEFWHIVLVAVGLYALFILARRVLNGKHPWAIGAVLLLIFWNIPQTFIPSLPIETYNHPITDEDHLNMDPSYAYLRSNSSAGDVLVITKYLDQYFRWVGGLEASQVMYYDYQATDAEAVIYRAIQANPCGWIALDVKRGYLWSRPVPMEDFVYEGKAVEYLGWFGDVYILRWCEQ